MLRRDILETIIPKRYCSTRIMGEKERVVVKIIWRRREHWWAILAVGVEVRHK
jgi:hypothetical protein